MQIMTCEIISHSPEETANLGIRLGELARAGDVFLLSGNLGAGKTCLAQGIARGLGVSEKYIFSPSFVLVRELHGRLPLYHIDLYRLGSVEEVQDLGIDDYLSGRGVCIIEWAEKGRAVLPPENLLIEFAYLADTERRLVLKPCGQRYHDLVGKLECPVPNQK